MGKPRQKTNSEDFFKPRGQNQSAGAEMGTHMSVGESASYTKGEQAILDMMVQLNGKTDQIRAQLESLENKFDSLQTRVPGAEQRIVSVEKELAIQEGQLKKLSEDSHSRQNFVDSAVKHQQLIDKKLEMLENIYRAGNVRIIGVPPLQEGESVMEFLVPFLCETLDISSETEFPVMLKAFRLPSRSTRWSESGGGTIIAVFSDSVEKEKLMDLVKRKGPIFYKEQRILFFHDLSQTTQNRRKSLLAFRKELAGKNVGATMLYPARLRVSYNGEVLVFSEIAAAEDFMIKWRQELTVSTTDE